VNEAKTYLDRLESSNVRRLLTDPTSVPSASDGNSNPVDIAGGERCTPSGHTASVEHPEVANVVVSERGATARLEESMPSVDSRRKTSNNVRESRVKSVASLFPSESVLKSLGPPVRRLNAHDIYRI